MEFFFQLSGCKTNVFVVVSNFLMQQMLETLYKFRPNMVLIISDFSSLPFTFIPPQLGFSFQSFSLSKCFPLISWSLLHFLFQWWQLPLVHGYPLQSLSLSVLPCPQLQLNQLWSSFQWEFHPQGHQKDTLRQLWLQGTVNGKLLWIPDKVCIVPELILANHWTNTGFFNLSLASSNSWVSQENDSMSSEVLVGTTQGSTVTVVSEAAKATSEPAVTSARTLALSPWMSIVPSGAAQTPAVGSDCKSFATTPTLPLTLLGPSSASRDAPSSTSSDIVTSSIPPSDPTSTVLAQRCLSSKI